MSKIPLSYNNGTLTLVIKGAVYQVLQDHPNRDRIKALLNKDNVEDQVLALFNAPEQAAAKSLRDVYTGKVTVRDGQVFYDNEVVHNSVATRIQDFQREGLPFDPLVKFLEKLMANPSFKSRNDLYDFLEHKNLPVTEDGDFLAYKAVREDWLDIYSGSIDNSVGQVVTMDRGKVDDNHDHHCSRGLHCGAMDYVTQYGGGNSRIVIVKINPADAISVPRDYSFMKLRVCRYVVVQEYSGDLTGYLYTNDGERVGEPVEDNDDEFLDELRNMQDYDSDYYDDDEDEDDYDSWVEDEDEGDDEFEDGDVSSESTNRSIADKLHDMVNKAFGRKPDGTKFHNQRDSKGRFSR